MNPSPDDRFPLPEPGADVVVRAQLDAEAGRVDAEGMADRVLARLNAAPAEPNAPASTRTRRFVMGVMVAGLAAAVLIGVFFLDRPREAAATPAEVVEAARVAHAQNTDRYYTQTVALLGVPGPLARILEPGLTATLCTRGDRFVVEPGFGGRGAWGRDEHGRVWVAPTRAAAARFDEAELPPGLREAVKIRGLVVGELLDEVLKDFDLAWGESPARASAVVVVTATRRGPTQPRQVRAAELVIERGSNVIHSLILRRQGVAGESPVVTFSLTGTADRDPAAYTAEGHLNPGAPVYGPAQPRRRLRVLVRHLGAHLAGQ